MGIADERRIAELRHRRSRNKSLIYAIGYITSIIPAIILAFNFEAFRQYVIVAFGGHVEPVVQQQVVAKVPTVPVRRQPIADRPARRANTRVASVQQPTRIEVQPAPIVRRQPQRLLPAEPKPDYEITLDLRKQRQRFPVELDYDTARVRVLPIDINQHPTMTPTDGTFDAQHSLTIAFSASFKPWITVSLDKVGDATVVNLVYQVESNAGRPLPFATTNLAIIRRKIVRKGQQAVAAVARLENEQVKVKAYLDAPGGKLWTEKKQAFLRSKELPSLISAARVPVATLEADLRFTDELIALANSIHGKKLRVVVDDAQRLTSD